MITDSTASAKLCGIEAPKNESQKRLP